MVQTSQPQAALASGRNPRRWTGDRAGAGSHAVEESPLEPQRRDGCRTAKPQPNCAKRLECAELAPAVAPPLRYDGAHLHAAPDGAWRASWGWLSINMALLTELSRSPIPPNSAHTSGTARWIRRCIPPSACCGRSDSSSASGECGSSTLRQRRCSTRSKLCPTCGPKRSDSKGLALRDAVQGWDTIKFVSNQERQPAYLARGKRQKAL